MLQTSQTLCHIIRVQLKVKHPFKTKQNTTVICFKCICNKYNNKSFLLKRPSHYKETGARAPIIILYLTVYIHLNTYDHSGTTRCYHQQIAPQQQAQFKNLDNAGRRNVPKPHLKKTTQTLTTQLNQKHFVRTILKSYIFARFLLAKTCYKLNTELFQWVLKKKIQQYITYT